MRCSIAAGLACMGVVLLSAGARAEGPIHGNVVLVLKGALSRGGEDRADAEFELAVRNGQWPKGCLFSPSTVLAACMTTPIAGSPGGKLLGNKYCLSLRTTT